MWKIGKGITYQLGLSFVFFMLSCSQQSRNRSHPEIDDENIAAGKILAERHCQSCHMLPDPAWLDAKTWEFETLPAMGPFLGIFQHNFQQYRSGRRDPFLEKGTYPEKPIMNADGWQYIMDYFRAVAPDSLSFPKKPVLELPILTDFAVVEHDFSEHPPTTSLVRIEEKKSGSRLWVADLFTKNLYRFDHALRKIDSIKTNRAIVDLDIRDTAITYCDIGEINPTNQKIGSLGSITEQEGRLSGTDSSWQMRVLARPVQVSSADFNKDGQTDYLVCEFGFLSGSLSLYIRKGAAFERSIIKAVPGATKTYIRDYNGDGLPDIYALIAQGNEGIFLFTNLGDGKFSEKTILQFPPVYGSSFFEFIDINKDGKEDIVYTCGDNADYSRVLKPYHGVYIFLNEGNDRYRQSYFYHINGCYKALARDFDHDGDMDIAAISFFADYSNNPDEGFVYLRNKGNLTFEPYRLPEAQRGRWITMDAGDLNGDGKTDLILGNFSYGPVMMKPAQDWKKGKSFLFLNNISGSKK